MPASYYQIYKGNKTSYTDSNLINDKKYYYYIYAFDESGNASSGKYLTATPFVPISTNDLQILQGSEVYGESTSYFDNDLVFLGTITGEYKSNSIFNSYGSHGSNYGSKSIWCSYCDYGSSYGSKSAFSTFALNPPVIYKNGVAVGYLTVNTSKSPRIDPRSLYLYKDEFY